MGEHYEIAVAAQCKLGEGPHFDARTQNLYWVDILSGTVHIHNLTTNETRSLDVGKYPSLIIPTPEDPQTAYVAVEDGIFLLNLQTGQKTLHSRPEIRQGYRYNDGKLDPQGRLWVGSMDISEEKNDGKLYMINRDGSFQTRLQDLSISNGLDWLDSKMFFIDSPTKHVDSFDYNPTTGELSNRTTVVSIKDNTGVPDGMTLTPDGKIMLICHWGGSGVYIYETTSDTQGPAGNDRRSQNQPKSPFSFPSSAETRYLAFPQAKKPFVSFCGEILLVTDPAQAQTAINRLLADGAKAYGVGFDMEWQPVFKKTQQRSPTALIQLSTENVCVLFWMTHLRHKMPPALRQFLTDDEIRKIGLSMGHEDSKRLKEEFGVTLRNVVDVSERAKRYGLTKIGMAGLSERLLGLSVNKKAQKSNYQQLYYAATDAYVTLLLFYKLEAFRADHHGFLQPSDRLGIYESDQIKFLYQLVSNLPHTTHATALQLPIIETSLTGERCVRFPDASVIKFTLEQEITPFGRIRPHSKALTISRTGYNVSAPGVKKMAAALPGAKKTASPMRQHPFTGSMGQPTSTGAQVVEERLPFPSFAAAAAAPPPIIPPMNLLHPNYQLHPAFIDVATSTISTLERSIAQLYSELEAARSTISNLQQTIESERAEFAAYKAAVEKSKASSVPVDSEASPSSHQIKNVKNDQAKSGATQSVAQKQPKGPKEKKPPARQQPRQRNLDSVSQEPQSQQSQKHAPQQTQQGTKKPHKAKKTQTPEKFFRQKSAPSTPAPSNLAGEHTNK